MAIVLDSSIVLVYMWVARWYLIWSGTAYSSREPDFTPCVGGVGVAHHGFLDFCVVICLSSSYVLLSKCCQCLRTVHSWSLLLFSLTFICLFMSCVLCTQCSQCLRTVHSWLLLRFSITSCILCTQCCQCLRTVHYWLLLRFSLMFIIFYIKSICWILDILHIKGIIDYYNIDLLSLNLPDGSLVIVLCLYLLCIMMTVFLRLLHPFFDFWLITLHLGY